MCDPLTQLAIIHGADKFGWHDYTPHYFRLFEPLRARARNVLEIGVGGYQDRDRGGESLAIWRDFFFEADVTGIDLSPKDLDLGPRVKIFRGNQVDRPFLDEIAARRGPFEIILDDGSHQNIHIIQTFKALLSKVAPGGIYVAEDLQTAHFPRYGGSLELEAPNALGFFARLFRQLIQNRANAGIAAMERFHNIVAVHKQGPGQPPILPDDEAAENWLCLGAAPPPPMAWDVATGKASGTEDLSKLVRKRAPDGISITGDHPILADDDGLAALLRAVPKDGYLVIEQAGTLPDDRIAELSRLFVQLDHREIAIFYPEAAIDPLARDILSLKVGAGRVVICKGDNSYPSNMAFDFDHPRVAAALEMMEAIVLEDGTETGLIQMADLLNRKGDAHRAERIYQRLEEIGASSRTYVAHASRRLRQAGDWQKSRELLLSAVANYPDDARVLSQLGSVYAGLKDWNRAEREFHRAVQCAPDDAVIRTQYASALSQLGRFEEAVNHAAEAAKLQPKHAAKVAQLGRFMSQAGRFDEAVEILRRAADLDPENASIFRSLSGAYFELGERGAAEQALAKAIALRPEAAEFTRWKQHLETA